MRNPHTDETRITHSEPLNLLGLRAKAWPLLGEAAVTMRLSNQGSATRVVMEEDAVSGPGKLVPAPLRAPGITWRNTESLRRLAFLAERRP